MQGKPCIPRMGTPHLCPKELLQHCRFSSSGFERTRQFWRASWLTGLLAERSGWRIGPASMPLFGVQVGKQAAVQTCCQANAGRHASSENRQAGTGKHSTQAAMQAEGRQTSKAGKQAVQGAGMQVGVEGHVKKIAAQKGILAWHSMQFVLHKGILAYARFRRLREILGDFQIIPA